VYESINTLKSPCQIFSWAAAVEDIWFDGGTSFWKITPQLLVSLDYQEHLVEPDPWERLAKTPGPWNPLCCRKRCE
jgi:hypothetical protein